MVNKNKSQIEREKKIIINYRRNNLLDKYVPEIVKSLSNLGYSSEVKAFERENFYSSIEDWKTINGDKIQKNIYLRDETCYKAEPRISTERHSLDDILFRAVGRTILPEGTFPSEIKRRLNPSVYIDKLFNKSNEEENADKAYERGKKVYSSLLKEFLKSEVPNNAYFCTQQMFSHYPFMTINYDSRLKDEKEKENFAKKYISDIFKESGIKSFDFVKIRDLESLDLSENWIFLDRHPAIDRGINLKNAKLMTLPFENLYESGIEYNLLKPKNLELELDKEIVLEFGGINQ